MLEIKNAWSGTSADKAVTAPKVWVATSLEFSLRALIGPKMITALKEWPQLKLKFAIHPLHAHFCSHLQETQDKSLQAVFKQKIFWGIKFIRRKNTELLKL